MMAALLVWLVQDMLQVLAMGIMLVPELFLMVVLYNVARGISSTRSVCVWLWVAFAGGLLWDLRWVGVPGMSGLANAVSVIFVAWLWGRTPIAGRTPALFAVVVGTAHFLLGVVHYLSWAVPTQAALRLFLIQQLVNVPAIALLCLLYAIKGSDRHVV